ncbi:MAG: hypothetical protein ABI654_13170 [Betaproteobacteria bacterium]
MSSLGSLLVKSRLLTARTKSTKIAPIDNATFLQAVPGASSGFQVKRAYLFALGLALAPTGLVAQEANPYNGTWVGKYTTPKGAPRTVVLVLSGSGGTWKNHVRIKQNPCLGREMPVTVARATATDLMIGIDGSKFLPGCKDFRARFSNAGGNAIEGRIGKMGKLTLVRQ